MSTKLTEIGDYVLVQTVASFGGKPPRARGGVLVLKSDLAAVKAEILKQAIRVRDIKGVQVELHLPVD